MSHTQKQDTEAGRALGRNNKGFSRKGGHSREASGVKMIQFIRCTHENVNKFDSDNSRLIHC